MKDQRFRESVKKHYGLEEEAVNNYINMAIPDAVDRYLSHQSKESLIKMGYDLSNGDNELISGLLSNRLHIFKNDFYKTPEGKTWYELNIEIPLALANQASRLYFSQNVPQSKELTLAERVAIDLADKPIDEHYDSRKRRRFPKFCRY